MADDTDGRPALAVTGVTGFVDRAVADGLADLGLATRLLARSPDAAPRLDRSVVLPFNYGDRPGCEAALRGVQTLFFVSGRENEHRLAQHRTVVEVLTARPPTSLAGYLDGRSPAG